MFFAPLLSEAHDLGLPVIRSEYKSSSIKQYARDNLVLRTETTSYHTPDLGVNKGVEHLPELRETMAAANDRYLDVQQDVLETFVDRGQLSSCGDRPSRRVGGGRRA